MIPAYVVVLFAHFFADFPVQAIGHRFMGQKATKVSHLLMHVAAYSLWLMVICGLLLDTSVGWWALLNGILHGCIDLWTSKGTYWLWGRAVHPVVEFVNDGHVRAHVGTDQRYVGPFFTLIGFDQFLHVALLFWSGYAMEVF